MRIRGPFLILRLWNSSLTANCVRHLERLSGHSYKELVELFKPFKCTQIDDGRRVYWQRMKLDTAQDEILAKLQIVIPPTTREKWNEVERRAKRTQNKGPSSGKSRSR